MKLIIAALSSLALLTLTSPSEARRLVPADWFQHAGPEKQRTEFWTAILQSKSGWVVYVSLLRTNMGIVKGNAGVAISVTPPDGETVRRKRRYAVEAFAERRTPSKRLALGAISIDAQRLRFSRDGQELSIDLPGVKMDVHLAPWTEGYKFGDGAVEVSADKGERMQYFFLVPRATTRGTLVLSGEAAGGAAGSAPVKIDLAGDGYLEHMVTNRSLTLWSRRWYVLNIFADDLTVHFLEGSPLPGYARLHGKLSYLAVTDRSGVRLATRRPRLRYRDEEPGAEGYSYPTEFQLDAAGKGAHGERATLHITYAQTKLQDAYVVLDQLGWAIRRLVAAILGDPVFFRFWNRYEIELTTGGETKRVQGRGLHQVVCLRP